MQINDLEHLEDTLAVSVEGGVSANIKQALVLQKAVSGATALSFFGDAAAIALSENNFTFNGIKL